MKKQIQGIALILFGILLMLLAMIDPWIPIIEDIGNYIILLIGLISGITGLVLNFTKDKQE